MLHRRRDVYIQSHSFYCTEEDDVQYTCRSQKTYRNEPRWKASHLKRPVKHTENKPFEVTTRLFLCRHPQDKLHTFCPTEYQSFLSNNVLCFIVSITASQGRSCLCSLLSKDENYWVILFYKKARLSQAFSFATSNAWIWNALVPCNWNPPHLVASQSICELIFL